MKISRWWITLFVAIAGCGPVNYWAGSYTNGLLDAFPFLKPNLARYKYPPGYDPNPPAPRSGPVPKKPSPDEPLPGAEPGEALVTTTPDAPATPEAPAKPNAAALPVTPVTNSTAAAPTGAPVF